MTNRTNFKKVRVFLPIKDGDILIRNSDGSFIGSPEFNDSIYEGDQKFREPIITFINDELGLHNWAIKFIQADETGLHFDGRLFAESKEDALKMVKIIVEKIPGIYFNWYYDGTIEKYLNADN